MFETTNQTRFEQFWGIDEHSRNNWCPEQTTGRPTTESMWVSPCWHPPIIPSYPLIKVGLPNNSWEIHPWRPAPLQGTRAVPHPLVWWPSWTDSPRANGFRSWCRCASLGWKAQGAAALLFYQGSAESFFCQPSILDGRCSQNVMVSSALVIIPSNEKLPFQ